MSDKWEKTAANTPACTSSHHVWTWVSGDTGMGPVNGMWCNCGAMQYDSQASYIATLRAECDALASVVTRQRSEIDTLRAAAEDAARAQMERDCAAVCGSCREGEELKYDYEWHHLFRGHLRNVCHADDIRAAFAALHPESTP